MSDRTLLSIFYSEYTTAPNWNALDELEICIHQDVIRFDNEIISPSVTYYHELDKNHISEGLGPQGNRHMVLKILAQEWLAKSGYSSKNEVFFAGLHPDVLSDNHACVFECGTTDPACVLIYLSYPIVQRVGIIPFPSVDTKDIFVYKFIRAKEFSSYNKNKIQSVKSKLKNLNQNGRY